MMSVTESFSLSKHTPLYENEPNERNTAIETTFMNPLIQISKLIPCSFNKDVVNGKHNNSFKREPQKNSNNQACGTRNKSRNKQH